MSCKVYVSRLRNVEDLVGKWSRRNVHDKEDDRNEKIEEVKEKVD